MADRTTTTDARQGERRPMALRTLIISMGLMLVALVGFMLWNYVDAPTSQPAQSQSAARQTVTGSPSGTGGGASSAASAGVPGGNPAYPAPAVKDANQR